MTLMPRLLPLLGACLVAGCAATSPAAPAVRGPLGPQDTPIYGQDSGPDRHHVQVFGGATTLNDGDDDGTTLGVSYEYRVSEGWGVGAFFDTTGGDIDSDRYGGALYLHPAENWVGVLGAGAADKISPTGAAVSGTDTFFRVGGGYQLFWGDWTITPSVYSDFIDGTHVWVYGVGLGRSF